MKTYATLLSVSVVAAAIIISAISAPVQAGDFAQNHPRRAEVLRRDNREQNRLNRNYGHLGGHYGQVSREDQTIRRQEQRDARLNGGHITRGEQRQLNHEENRVNNQINRDRMN